MKILVTGATGRIGKYLVAALLEEGENVTVLVREPEKAKELWGDSVDMAQGDITDRTAVEKAVKGTDVVYHLAALVSYDAAREELFAVNVEGTRNVLGAAKGKRVVHLSTASVYGKKAVSPITERTVFAPTDPYGESKAEADDLARTVKAVILRPTVVYGPGFAEGFFRLFSMIEKRRMVIAGDGKNRLQWTHINDLLSALLLARKRGVPGEAYDIVSDDVMTQEELLGLMARLLGAPEPKTHVPLPLLRTVGSLFIKPSFIETVASDRVFDCSKAVKDLGWEPKMTFERGLKETVDEYLLQKNP